MFVLIMFAVGVIVGSVSTQLILWTKRVGNLRVDTSDPDGPYLFLELTKGLESVTKKDIVVLKVRKENLISQE